MLLALVLDFAILIILFGGSCLGYKKGFFLLTVKPCKTIICLGLSFVLCKNVGLAMFTPMVKSYIVSHSITEKSEIVEYIPTISFVEQMLDKSHFVIESRAVGLISSILAFILVFCLSRITISFMIYLVNLIFDRGFIGKINRVLGFICAAVVSVAVAYVFTLISNYLIHTQAFEGAVCSEEFRGGPLYGFFSSLSS